MPRKVLYAADSFEHLLEYHLPYLEELSRKGMEIHAAASGVQHACPYISRCFSLPYAGCGLSYEAFSVIRSLIPIIRNEAYDLIVLNGSRVSHLVRCALLFLSPPRPYVVHIADGYPIEKDSSFFAELRILLVEKALRCVTDEILVLNPEDYAFAKRFKLFSNKLYAFPGLGLDLSAYHPASTEEKREARYTLGIPESAFVLIYMADFTAHANQAMLLQAMRFLPHDICLYLPGEGPLLESCREKAEALGVLPKVSFPGIQRDWSLCCHAADVAVSAALQESPSLPLAAALASGLPVVASDIKGNRSLVRDGINGYLYPSDNAYKFAEKIIKIYSDRELQENLGQLRPEFLAPYALESVKPGIINALLF